MDQQAEGKLLLYCLGMDTEETRATKIEQLSNPDWDDAVQQSITHAIAPLLYHRLKALDTVTDVPSDIMQKLRKMYLHNASKNMRLYHELTEVLQALQNDGIPVIVLKGAHLAETIYGNIALRSMIDIDLLVGRADLSRTENRLLEMDYGPLNRPSVEEQCKKRHRLIEFTQTDRIPIEVHWTIDRLNSPFEIDIDGLWKRAQSSVIAGTNVLVLSPEDLLLYLCLHTSLQHWFTIGLRPFCDIAELLRYYQAEMDWEQVLTCTHQWGVSKCVYLTLYLTKELLGATIPKNVLHTLEPHDLDPKLAIWAKEQVFPPSFPNLAQRQKVDRLGEKISSFIRVVFPSPEVMASKYSVSPSSKRIYLYYPVRLMDLLHRHSRSAWRLLRRDEEIVVSAGRVDKVHALVEWLTST